MRQAVVTAPYSAAIRGFEELRKLREELDNWMADLGVPEAPRLDLLVAASELVTNGIDASPDDEAFVRASRFDQAVRIVVSNVGPPFNGVWAEPDLSSDRGRGLGLVRAMTDTLAFTHENGCTEATVTKAY
jgi:anti-sigma regulatory factor (Ser/Thr protein kinase)